MVENPRWHFRIHKISSGKDVCQEGFVSQSAFGPGIAAPLYLPEMENLHIEAGDKEVSILMENPVLGGSVVVCKGGSEQLAVPEKRITAKGESVTVFAALPGKSIHILLDKIPA